MNVNKVLTMNYEKMDTWSSGKNEPKTNPNEPKRTQILSAISVADQKGRNERNFYYNKGL
jgi:hypothetical protein